MLTVKVTTIIVDSLLPRPKLDCDVCYDAAVKGASVVVQVVEGLLLGVCCMLGTLCLEPNYKV